MSGVVILIIAAALGWVGSILADLPRPSWIERLAHRLLTQGGHVAWRGDV